MRDTTVASTRREFEAAEAFYRYLRWQATVYGDTYPAAARTPLQVLTHRSLHGGAAIAKRLADKAQFRYEWRQQAQNGLRRGLSGLKKLPPLFP